MRSQVRRTCVAIVSLLVASLLQSSVGVAVAEGRGPLEDVTLELSAISLAVDESISVEDARMQMLNQDSQIAVNESASRALGSSYAGSYIDRKSGTLNVYGPESDKLLEWFVGEGRPAGVSINAARHPRAYFEGPLFTGVKADLSKIDTEVESAVFLVNDQKLQVRVAKFNELSRPPSKLNIRMPKSCAVVVEKKQVVIQL